MSTHISIRRIQPDETFHLRHKLLRPHQTLDDVRYPGDENGFHFGAFSCESDESEQKLIGIASFYVQNHPDVDKNTATSTVTQLRVRGVAIEPQHRSLGLGTRLLQFGINHVIEKYGTVYIWLNGRSSASHFYERLGFRKKGEEYESSEGTGPHWLFEMDISSK